MPTSSDTWNAISTTDHASARPSPCVRAARHAPRMVAFAVVAALAMAPVAAATDPAPPMPAATAAPASTLAVSTASAPLRRIPFTVESGLIVVPLRLNGSAPLRVVLDTGMPEGVLLFDGAAAEGLGLEWIATANVAGNDGDRPFPRGWR